MAQTQAPNTADETEDTQLVQDEVVEGEPVENEPVEIREDAQNIIRSIKVSTDYDLLLWANGLGLQVDNTRKALQTAIVEFYGIPLSMLEQDAQTDVPATQEESVVAQEEDTAATPVLEEDAAAQEGDTIVIEEETLASGESEEIIIKKASNARYFSYDKIKEDVFILQGDIEIIINQQSKKRQHVIFADKLIYNETTRIGTALGEVRYEVYEYSGNVPEIPSGVPIEDFNGQIVSFQIDDFNADVIMGNTITEQEVRYGKDKSQSENLLFRIYSPNISRSKESIIAISNATFTSSKAVPPIYHIKLKRMWLLKPDEWVINNASVYVGEIPMMWIPFFFNPGDKFFFNPSIGYKTRTGGFINTSTYLIGERRADDSEDEFLSLFNFSKQKPKKKIIKGLFLEEVEEGDTYPTYPDDWSLIYILDYYTGLGGYTALDGSFSDIWHIDSWNIVTGLAFTQTVYNVENSYFNYYIDENGKFQRNFDKGYFFNVEIPFRFRLDTDLKTSIGSWYNTSLSFGLYSDAYIEGDFAQRSLDFSWDEILDPNKRIKELNDQPSRKSSYYWQWNNNLSIPTSDWIGNYMNVFSISNLKAQLSWGVKSVLSTDIPEAYLLGPGTVERGIESYFFYPQQIEFPSYQAKVQGTLFSLDSNKLDFSNGIVRKEEKTEESEPDILEEEGDILSEDSTSIEASSDSEIQKQYQVIAPLERFIEEDVQDLISPIDDSLASPSFSSPSVSISEWDWTQVNFQIDYSVSNSLNQIIYYDYEEWQRVLDVDIFDTNYVDYGYLTNSTTYSLAFDTTLLDDWLSYKYAINLDTKYKILNYRDNLLEDEIKSREQSGINYTTETLSNTHTVALYPLRWISLMSNSSISYISNYDIGKNVFSTVRDVVWYDFDNTTMWRNHQFAQNYLLAYGGTSHSLQWDIGLPPLSITHMYGYGFQSYYVDFAVSTKIIENQTTELYEYNPLDASITFKFFDDNMTFNERIAYEYEYDYIERLSSTVKLWWFQSILTSQYELAYNFNSSSYTFEPESLYDRKLRFTQWQNSVKYNSKQFHFWKDRVSYSIQSDVNFDYDFLRFTNTSFSWSYGVTFAIYQYLSFSISSSFKNDIIYMYFDNFANKLGLEKRDFWEDVQNSLAIGDVEKLKQGAFKTGGVDIGIAQDLGGWVFNFLYKGVPKRVVDNGSVSYQWSNLIEISVYWKPLPEFKSEAFFRDDLWSLEEEIE